MKNILNKLADALGPGSGSKPKTRPAPRTMVHVLHRLWSERVGTDGYDKDEKQLWLALQRFVERKGGDNSLLDDYRS